MKMLRSLDSWRVVMPAVVLLRDIVDGPGREICSRGCYCRVALLAGECVESCIERDE
jgi:hypothetical protein